MNHSLLAPLRSFLLSAFCFLLFRIAPAQEALRMSMAGADAARARRLAATKPGYYNLDLGPTAWRFSSGLGVQFTDNADLTETNPQSDFIFTPSINAQMVWPITDKNSLNVGLGLGYSAYVLNPGLSRIYITPGSGISFDIYSGDFVFNVHDRFSITEYSYQDPTVAGTGGYSQFQNDLGLSALWDLNKGVVRAGYDHINYVPFSGGQGTPQGQSEMVYGSAGYKASSMVLAGLELGAGLINYSTANQPDAYQWNAGAFTQAILSQYIRVQASAGYTVYAPRQSDPTSTATDFSGMYAQLQLTHRVNQYLDYTLSGGRTINLAYYGGTIESYFVNWTARWNILRKFTLSTFVNYQYGQQLQAGGELFNWATAGISLGRPITKKLYGSLGYQGVWRESDQPNRSYVVDTISLQFTYRF